MLKSLKLFFHRYLVPHRLLTRITYLLMHASHFPFRDRFMAHMIRRYDVRVDEALEPDYTDRKLHPNINSFFVRALKPEARPIAADGLVCSPADGTVSQLGTIDDDSIIQAKGHRYSLTELLGGSQQRAAAFRNGQFTTIYLSPSDYHRVHMPFAGQLQEMIHVPGKLLSVAPFLIDNVPNLFARNERVVSIFDTAIGPMAVVLVGAVNVGSIETVWSGVVTPPLGKTVSVTRYHAADAVQLNKGDEMGRFNMGSTVIVVFGSGQIEWLSDIHCDDKIRMGAAMASVIQRQS